MRPVDPRWLVPDEHELAIAIAIATAGLKVHLVPSTPAQRRARAWHLARRPLKAAVSSSSPAS